MGHRFRCPGCRQELLVGEASLGRQVRCPRCAAVLQVPAAAAPPHAAPPAPVPPAPAPPTPPAAGLGEPLRVFRPSWADIRDSLIWGGGMVGVALVLLLGTGVYALLNAAGRRPAFLIVTALFVLLLLGLGALMLAMAWWVYNRRICLLADGVREEAPWTNQVLRWDDIDEMADWLDVGNLSVLTRAGKQFSFSAEQIKGGAELVAAIREQGLRRLVPRTLARLRNGETVLCGRVEADRAGLTCYMGHHPAKKKPSLYAGPWPMTDHRQQHARAAGDTTYRFAWDEVQGMEVHSDDSVYLHARGARVSLNCRPDEVPNLLVLVLAARELAAAPPAGKMPSPPPPFGVG